jgi:hypothetical protein
VYGVRAIKGRSVRRDGLLQCEKRPEEGEDPDKAGARTALAEERRIPELVARQDQQRTVAYRSVFGLPGAVENPPELCVVDRAHR